MVKKTLEAIRSTLEGKGYADAHGRAENGEVRYVSGPATYNLMYDVRSPNFCTLVIGGKVVKEGHPESVLEYAGTTLGKPESA